MSVDNPEISLIIPACNAEPYLEKCLDSVIRQSFFGWELIIVDDGSSDRTGEVAERYAAADSRIKVIHTSRQGVSAARNAGIDAAVGVFLAFADADDHLKPDYLKELLEHAKQNNADITQCSFVFEDEEGNTTPDPDRTEAVFRDRDEIMNAYFRGTSGDIRVSVWAKLFRREAFAGICFDPELRIYEDAYYVFKCCRKAETVCCFNAPLYSYVQHAGSAVHSDLPEKYNDFFTMFERQKEEFKKDSSVRKRIARREAETALWLMRIMMSHGKEKELWMLRKKALGITGDVIFSSAPVMIKLKLTGVALLPHLYFSMLRRKVSSRDEKV